MNNFLIQENKKSIKHFSFKNRQYFLGSPLADHLNLFTQLTKMTCYLSGNFWDAKRSLIMKTSRQDAHLNVREVVFI